MHNLFNPNALCPRPGSMRKRMLPLLLVALTLAAPVVAKDKPRNPLHPRDTAIPLPGRALNIWCAGSRGPVVILDAGWSGDSRAWGRLFADLAPRYRVCAQDRAGSGFSDPGPLPRNGEAIARDLKAVLDEARIPGPYILVGHSLGALNMLTAAHLFPQQVKGVILVDPALPQRGLAGLEPFEARARMCLQAARTGATPKSDPKLNRCRTSRPERGESQWEARLSELEELGGSTSAAILALSPGSIAAPVIALTAAGTDAEADTSAARLARHQRLASVSAAGSARLVTGSGHMMMHDRPDAITAAIDEIAAQQQAAPRRRNRR